MGPRARSRHRSARSPSPEPGRRRRRSRSRSRKDDDYDDYDSKSSSRKSDRRSSTYDDCDDSSSRRSSRKDTRSSRADDDYAGYENIPRQSNTRRRPPPPTAPDEYDVGEEYGTPSTNENSGYRNTSQYAPSAGSADYFGYGSNGAPAAGSQYQSQPAIGSQPIYQPPQSVMQTQSYAHGPAQPQPYDHQAYQAPQAYQSPQPAQPTAQVNQLQQTAQYLKSQPADSFPPPGSAPSSSWPNQTNNHAQSQVASPWHIPQPAVVGTPPIVSVPPQQGAVPPQQPPFPGPPPMQQNLATPSSLPQSASPNPWSVLPQPAMPAQYTPQAMSQAPIASTPGTTQYAAPALSNPAQAHAFTAAASPSPMMAPSQAPSPSPTPQTQQTGQWVPGENGQWVWQVTPVETPQVTPQAQYMHSPTPPAPPSFPPPPAQQPTPAQLLSPPMPQYPPAAPNWWQGGQQQTVPVSIAPSQALQPSGIAQAQYQGQQQGQVYQQSMLQPPQQPGFPPPPAPPQPILGQALSAPPSGYAVSDYASSAISARPASAPVSQTYLPPPPAPVQQNSYRDPGRGYENDEYSDDEYKDDRQAPPSRRSTRDNRSRSRFADPEDSDDGHSESDDGTARAADDYDRSRSKRRSGRDRSESRSRDKKSEKRSDSRHREYRSIPKTESRDDLRRRRQEEAALEAQHEAELLERSFRALKPGTSRRASESEAALRRSSVYEPEYDDEVDERSAPPPRQRRRSVSEAFRQNNTLIDIEPEPVHDERQDYLVPIRPVPPSGNGLAPKAPKTIPPSKAQSIAAWSASVEPPLLDAYGYPAAPPPLPPFHAAPGPPSGLVHEDGPRLLKSAMKGGRSGVRAATALNNGGGTGGGRAIAGRRGGPSDVSSLDDVIDPFEPAASVGYEAASRLYGNWHPK